MNIRNWPLDRIMQLPDHCFGRRYPVTVFAGVVGVGVYYDISEMALPEKCVIWELVLYSYGDTGNMLYGWSFVLGDVLPTTDAQFDANEVLLADLGGMLTGRKSILSNSNRGLAFRSLRVPIQSSGRRIIGRYLGAETSGDFAAVFTISSVPTEVPDWMFSGLARSL